MTFRVRVFLKHASKMFTDKRGKFICIRWKYCSAAITPFLYAIYSCIKLCHACSCSFIISLCSKNLLHPNKVLHIQSKSFDSLLQTFLANYNLSFRSLLVSTHFFVSISSFQSCPSRNSANCFCNNCTNSLLIQCTNIFFTLKFLISSSSIVVWRKIFLIWLS